jgi:hypothetical protein
MQMFIIERTAAFMEPLPGSYPIIPLREKLKAISKLCSLQLGSHGGLSCVNQGRAIIKNVAAQMECRNTSYPEYKPHSRKQWLTSNMFESLR